MSETMTETKIVEKYGPILYYRVVLLKKVPFSRGRGKEYMYTHAQTYTCYNRVDADNKRQQLSAKAPSMRKFPVSTNNSSPRSYTRPVSAVRIEVWACPAGYKYHKSGPHERPSRLEGIKPVYVETIPIDS